MVKIHKFDIVDKQNVCGRKGANSDVNYENVTCLDCLKTDEKEWKEQVHKFEGQPKINAIQGLKIVQERMKCVLNKEIKNE